tara:strand:+ start:894 stop:1094 length:201 start_codon:yes stop_codon:yes gene_type:complete
MSNNTKIAALFDELSFADVFETFDEEYLTLIAHKNPEQLKRMCIFLSLDDQIRKEKIEKLSLKDMN